MCVYMYIYIYMIAKLTHVTWWTFGPCTMWRCYIPPISGKSLEMAYEISHMSLVLLLWTSSKSSNEFHWSSQSSLVKQQVPFDKYLVPGSVCWFQEYIQEYLTGNLSSPCSINKTRMLLCNICCLSWRKWERGVDAQLSFAANIPSPFWGWFSQHQHHYPPVESKNMAWQKHPMNPRVVKTPNIIHWIPLWNPMKPYETYEILWNHMKFYETTIFWCFKRQLCFNIFKIFGLTPPGIAQFTTTLPTAMRFGMRRSAAKNSSYFTAAKGGSSMTVIPQAVSRLVLPSFRACKARRTSWELNSAFLVKELLGEVDGISR